MQLAVEDDKTALPYVRDALRSEQVEAARLNIARALKTLGDKGGINAMIEICVNPTTTMSARLIAAQEMPLEENSKCVEQIIRHLIDSTNPVEIQGALMYLTYGVDTIQAPSDAFDQLTRALDAAIGNTAPSIRQEAAMCIGKFNVTSARAKLIEAEAKESNPGVKQAMRSAIQRLMP